MAYPTFTAGEPIRAWQLSALQETEVEQGTDITVNNSTTLINTSLVIPVGINDTYWYHLMVTYKANTIGDIKFSWAGVPVGGFMDSYVWGTGLHNSTANISSVDRLISRFDVGETNVGGVSTGQNSSYQEVGVIVGAGPAIANVVLQFAQDTAHASDCTVSSVSRVKYRRIE